MPTRVGKGPGSKAWGRRGAGAPSARAGVQPSLRGSVLPSPLRPVVSSCAGPWCVCPGRRPGLCQGNTGKRDRKAPAPPAGPGPIPVGPAADRQARSAARTAASTATGPEPGTRLLPGQEGLVQAAGQTLLLPPAPPTLAPEAQPCPRLVWPQGARARLLPLCPPHRGDLGTLSFSSRKPPTTPALHGLCVHRGVPAPPSTSPWAGPVSVGLMGFTVQS